MYSISYHIVRSERHVSLCNDQPVRQTVFTKIHLFSPVNDNKFQSDTDWILLTNRDICRLKEPMSMLHGHLFTANQQLTYIH